MHTIAQSCKCVNEEGETDVPVHDVSGRLPLRIIQIRVVGQMRNDPLNRNPGAFYHWLADHNLRTLNNAIRCFWLLLFHTPLAFSSWGLLYSTRRG
jgi:hypothetical protein